ncbi:AGAP007804-PA [Anopheles gambiae str. PEST]|uniref:AGAP007804-PA n=1 Tax=Anopheles gambiae TaxID=7165 RepID=Q7Q3C1_ANOGA|nr:AGAP007804-PA [Anopheles gambiae str. PEST]
MSLQCRVCLDALSNAYYLFEETGGITLAEIIQFCAQVQIAEDDGLPTFICPVCCEDAQQAFAFIQKARQSDEKLRALQVDPESVAESNVEMQELVVELLMDSDEIHNQLHPVESLEEHFDLTSDTECALDLTSEQSEENLPDLEIVSALADQDQEGVSLATNNSNGPCYYCCHEDCLLTFHTKEALKRHAGLNHPTEQHSAPNVQHRCDNCDRGFATAEDQRIHQTAFHLKRTIVKALLKHAVQQHSIRKAVHDPTRPVRCEVCFKLFRCRTKRNYHQSIPYKPLRYRFCKTCGVRFHRKSNLRIHERVHSNTYYAVCPHCDKKYKTQSQLKQHLKVHTQERSLGCRYCAKRFMYTSDRKRHEMTHTGEYPFVCGGCSRKFSRNRPYTQHVAVCKAAAKDEA